MPVPLRLCSLNDNSVDLVILAYFNHLFQLDLRLLPIPTFSYHNAQHFLFFGHHFMVPDHRSEPLVLYVPLLIVYFEIEEHIADKLQWGCCYEATLRAERVSLCDSNAILTVEELSGF